MVMKKLFVTAILTLILLLGTSTCQEQQGFELQSTQGQAKSEVKTESISTSNPEIKKIPAPSKGKANLTGILEKKGSGGQPDMPYVDVRLIVGTLIKDSEGNNVGARVSLMNSPKARTDSNGKFTFIDLDPDVYTLVLEIPPLEMVKLNDPVTGKDMLIKLEEGESKDLGILSYPDLPYWSP